MAWRVAEFELTLIRHLWSLVVWLILCLWRAPRWVQRSLCPARAHVLWGRIKILSCLWTAALLCSWGSHLSPSLLCLCLAVGFSRVNAVTILRTGVLSMFCLLLSSAAVSHSAGTCHVNQVVCECLDHLSQGRVEVLLPGAGALHEPESGRPFERLKISGYMWFGQFVCSPAEVKMEQNGRAHVEYLWHLFCGSRRTNFGLHRSQSTDFSAFWNVPTKDWRGGLCFLRLTTLILGILKDRKMLLLTRYHVLNCTSC